MIRSFKKSFKIRQLDFVINDDDDVAETQFHLVTAYMSEMDEKATFFVVQRSYSN